MVDRLFRRRPMQNALELAKKHGWGVGTVLAIPGFGSTLVITSIEDWCIKAQPGNKLNDNTTIQAYKSLPDTVKEVL